jgi:two-component system, cell cycle sensor histidine kinase and response regulator CckA
LRPAEPNVNHLPHSFDGDRQAMTSDSLFPSDLPGSRAVLVIDDAGVVRRLAYRLLSEAGYRVFEAGSAVEALEVVSLARGRLDVVLVDVVMPEVNGVDLARMLRERVPQANVIFMSAYPAEVLAREGLRDLRVQFLAKPFTREELLKAVASQRPSHKESNGEPHEADRPGKT